MRAEPKKQAAALNEHSIPLLRAYHGCERSYKSWIFYRRDLQHGR
jgi:hypothetical protein